jgi:hypothetical protein
VQIYKLWRQTSICTCVIFRNIGSSPTVSTIKKAVVQVRQGAIQLYIIILIRGWWTLFTWLVFRGKWKGGQPEIEISIKHNECRRPWESSVHQVCYHHVTWTVAVAWLWCRDDTSKCITSMLHMDSWLGDLRARVAWHMWCHGGTRAFWNKKCHKPFLKHHAVTWELRSQSCITRVVPWGHQFSQERRAASLSWNIVQIQDFSITLNILLFKVAASIHPSLPNVG